METSFNKLVNYFMHPGLRIEKSIYERSRISISALIVIFAITVLYVIFYFSISKGIYWDFKSILNYIDVLSLTGALLLIKRKGWVQFALSLMAFVYLMLFSGSIFISGGINSYDISWLIVLSAASYMLISIRTGIFITLTSFVVITGFYFFRSSNYITSESTQAQLTLSYKYFNLTLVLSLLSLLVYFLVRGNEKLQEIIQQNKEQKVREEIARDFHDQIANKLASLRHLAEMIKLKSGSEDHKQISSKIDLNAKEVYDNFRDFIWTLDSKSDRLNELFMYLRDYTEDYFKFSDKQLFVNSTPDQLSDLVLPGHYSKEIVPMIKDTIWAVFNLSNAKDIYLHFIVTKTLLTISIKENGNDNEFAKHMKSNSTEKMKARAVKVNAEFIVSDLKPQGTEVVFNILLPI